MSVHHQLWQLWNRRGFGELCRCEISLLFGLTCCPRRDNTLPLMDTISFVVVATCYFTKYQGKFWYLLIQYSDAYSKKRMNNYIYFDHMHECSRQTYWSGFHIRSYVIG